MGVDVVEVTNWKYRRTKTRAVHNYFPPKPPSRRSVQSIMCEYEIPPEPVTVLLVPGSSRGLFLDEAHGDSKEYLSL